MLKDYIEQCGAACMVFRNNEISVAEIKSMNFDAIVISPGPKAPKDAGILMELIDKFYNKLPILGVCLGHQALAQYFGAVLDKAQLPRHGKVDLMEHNYDEMFNNVPSPFFATRYHSLIINNLPEILIPTSYCSDELMAFRHCNLPIWAVQFHPESSQTVFGIEIIRNFVKQIAKTKLLQT